MQVTTTLVLVLVFAFAPAAHADELEADDDVLVVTSAMDGPEPFDDRTAIEDWNDRRGWSYGTDQLMPLTRGMDDAGIPPAARWPLYLFTVPFDLMQLPLAAIAGLYGS